MRGAWAIGALAVGGLAGACVDFQPFQCSADEQCHGVVQGWCEASGFCSYPDRDCPSGRRYSDLAGALGRQCVEGDGGSSTGLEPGTSSEGSDTGEPTGESSTGPGIPVCGNGVIEGDEECDELDTVDGDGCNTDCVAGGSVRWSAVVAEKAGGDDRLFGSVRLASGDVVAVGFATGTSSRNVLLSRWTVDGEEVQRAAYDVDGSADEAEAVTQDGVGRLWVCGRATLDGVARPWVWRWDADLTDNPAVDVELPMEVTGYCHDIVHIEGSSFAAVGGSGTQAWEYAFSSSDVAGGSVAIPVPPMGESGESRLKAAVRAPGGELLVAGQDEEVGVAFEPVALGDLGPSLVALPATQVQSMAVTDDMILLAGWHAEPASLDDLWVSAHDRADGTERWHWTADRRPLVDEVEDVALDPAGYVYAVGHVSNDDPDRWVGKLDPEGNLVWEREDYEGALLGPDRMRSVVVLPDGDVIVVAEITSEAGDLDGWIARIAP
ncbi:MAG: hypothetical protein H6712_26515 [Myxococcales bacterium]|nr:hypothetical protein [Myxococcales bacterium]MCB9717430.1 hypothetical protein [Myxococcales bacterium]